MDNTYDNDSVPVLDPAVDHKKEVVNYLSDVSRAVMGPGETMLGYNALQIARANLARATAPLGAEQVKLEGLNHAHDILQGMYDTVPSDKLLAALMAVSAALDKKGAPLNK